MSEKIGKSSGFFTLENHNLKERITDRSKESTKSPTDKKTKFKRKQRLHLAPLNTPLSNRLQTLGLMWHTVSIPFFLCLFLLALSLGWVVWLSVILPYFVWWYGFDLHTPTNGKVVYRTRDWMKNFIVWEWFVNYFPINVHKTCDLEPTFSSILVKQDSLPDDEEDLISEDSRTLMDSIFKKLRLSKRINDINPFPQQVAPNDSESKENYKIKRITTGPRYIFGYHPHGVISMGAMGTFATNALRNEPYEPPAKFLKPLFHDPSKGERLFPDIGNIFPLTLSTQFTIPFYRDYLLGLGLTSASAKNIKSLISNGDNSVCIVVGGAQESLLNNMVAPQYKVGNGYKSHDESDSDLEDEPEDKSELKSADKSEDKPEDKSDNKSEYLSEYLSEDGSDSKSEDKSDNSPKREIKLVLHKRRGFVKLAIELGNVSLVPTFAFGEADIFKLTTPKPGSWGSKLQSWLKAKFLFTLPFFSARGVFIYDFGFLAYRNPINICIGRPIHVPAGLLAEYKLKHPDFDNILENEAKKNKNNNSDKLANIFKGSQEKESSSAKTNVPPEILGHYHKLYVDELKRVYEENKHRFGYGDVELNIIE